MATPDAIANDLGTPASLTIKYRNAPTDDFVRSCVACAVHIHRNLGPGDILIFLPGENEIQQVVGRLTALLRDVLVIPLKAGLADEDQAVAFAPSTKRKCIVSTNVAESLTISGIVYVIDSGLSKQNVYNPRARMSMLQIRPISKESADQRAGRAGGTHPGFVFRMYTEESFNDLRTFSAPDILVSDARGLLAKIYAASGTIDKLEFHDPPSPDTVMTGLQELVLMNLLSSAQAGQLTDLGMFAATTSIDPLWVYVIDQGRALDCDAPMLSLAAIHNTQRSIFLEPWGMDVVEREQRHTFADPFSDHITMLNAFNAFANEKLRNVMNMKQWCMLHGLNHAVLEEIWNIRSELKIQIKKKYGSRLKELPLDDPRYHTSLRKALARGLHLNAAMAAGRGEEYRTLVGEQYSLIAPKSFVWKAQPKCLVFSEFTKLGRAYLTAVTAIKPEWIADLPAFQDEHWPRNFFGGFRMPQIKEVFDAARLKKE